MIIRKKRIRNLNTYLGEIPKNSEFRLTVEISEEQRVRLLRLGFSELPDSGETVLPSGIGPVSRFNADGKWKVHRDQPKEDRYIRTVKWSWKQWTGGGGVEEHEDFRDIYRKCYPRSPIPAPGLELTYVERNGSAFVMAPPFKNSEAGHADILHSINLFLELFGECELVKVDLTKYADVSIQRLSWKLLPPGEHPWQRIHSHLKEILKRSSENTQSVILDRQDTILLFKPDEQFIGTGGFSDYIAYVFKNRGVVVLESIRKGNAIYVFGQNWLQFSQLTKSDIINAELHVARLIHTKGWKTKLARLMDYRSAA